MTNESSWAAERIMCYNQKVGINILEKAFVVFSIMGTVISIGYRSAVLPVLPFIAWAQESFKETEAQQFARDEMNRRRNELRSLFETRRDKLRERAGNVLSEENRQRILRIADSINKINARKADQHLNLIGRIDSILQRIVVRTEEAKRRGVNVSDIRPKAQEANKLVAEARSLVLSQAGVIYTIEGASKKEISAAAKAARDNLRNDIRSVRTKIKEARAAVIEVIKAVNGVNEQQ